MTDQAASAQAQGWEPDVALYEAQASRLVALAAALAGPSNADDVVSAAVIRSFTTPGWRNITNQGSVRKYLARARATLRKRLR